MLSAVETDSCHYDDWPWICECKWMQAWNNRKESDSSHGTFQKFKMVSKMAIQEHKLKAW